MLFFRSLLAKVKSLKVEIPKQWQEHVCSSSFRPDLRATLIPDTRLKQVNKAYDKLAFGPLSFQTPMVTAAAENTPISCSARNPCSS